MWLDDEEVGVSVFFDGEEDGAVILVVELYGFGCAGGLDVYWFGGVVWEGKLVCGAGAAKEEECCDGYDCPFCCWLGWGMQGHGECLLGGVSFGRGLRRRFYIKGDLMGLVGGAFWVVEAGVEGVGVLEFAAQVHGEFEFPAHGFDDVGGGDFVALGVVEGDFDVGALLEGGDFEVDAQAAAIGVWLCGEFGNLCFFWDCSG